MAVSRARAHDAVRDAMSMVILAIGSLVFLELAAVNLRGETRPPRAARELRSQR
ncbi:hypothetical protein BH20CHL7_BH20CHL7_19680 [soil metagenome]